MANNDVISQIKIAETAYDIVDAGAARDSNSIFVIEYYKETESFNTNPEELYKAFKAGKDIILREKINSENSSYDEYTLKDSTAANNGNLTLLFCETLLNKNTSGAQVLLNNRIIKIKNGSLTRESSTNSQYILQYINGININSSDISLKQGAVRGDDKFSQTLVIECTEWGSTFSSFNVTASDIYKAIQNRAKIILRIKVGLTSNTYTDYSCCEISEISDTGDCKLIFANTIFYNDAFSGYRYELTSNGGTLSVVKQFDSAAALKTFNGISVTSSMNITQDNIGDGTEYKQTHNDFSNEYKAQVDANAEAIEAIESKIPDDASIDNKLVTEDSVKNFDELFIIKISDDLGYWYCDKNYDEIKKAYTNNKQFLIRYKSENVEYFSALCRYQCYYVEDDIVQMCFYSIASAEASLNTKEIILYLYLNEDKVAIQYATYDKTFVSSINDRAPSADGSLSLTQSDIKDDGTYVRTHNDFTDEYIEQIGSTADKAASNEEAISEINKKIPDTASENNQLVPESVTEALGERLDNTDENLETVTDRLSTAEDKIENLEARGRFLSSWNAVTGKPETDPDTLPYKLKAGDYFIVSVVATEGSQTNKQPEAKIISGKTGLYYTGSASVTVESRELGVGDYYTFDGTKYVLVQNSQKTVSFANVAGEPRDNIKLAAELEKVDTVTAGLVTEITNRTAADTALGSRIDGVESDVDALETKVGAADDMASETGSLFARIKAEADARSDADTTLDGKIDAVSAVAEGAVESISELSDKVAGIESDLTAEVTARTNADTAINNEIGTKSSESPITATTIYRAIEDEIVARVAADNTLTTTVNSKVDQNAYDTKVAEIEATIAEKADESDLETLEGRVSANETNIVTNARAISDEEDRATEEENKIKERVDNLEARGRFLSSWDAEKGKPSTYPIIPDDATYPYTYSFKAGDYYIVNNVSESGDNLRPAGDSIKKSSKSSDWIIGTEVESEKIEISAYYTFDGTKWVLIKNTQKEMDFINLTGNPRDNSALDNELDTVLSDANAFTTTEIQKLNFSSLSVGADKTLASISETDGIIDATFQDISITKAQVSDFSHEHNLADIIQGDDEELILDSGTSPKKSE